MFDPSSKTAIKALCSVGESFEQRMNASDTVLHSVKVEIVADRQPVSSSGSSPIVYRVYPWS